MVGGVYRASDSWLGRSRPYIQKIAQMVSATIAIDMVRVVKIPPRKDRIKRNTQRTTDIGLLLPPPLQGNGAMVKTLWRDLGAWRFFGVQLLFAGTISQFLLAPLLWSFWLMLIGVPHPLDGVLAPAVALTFAGLFLLTEIIGITVMAIAVTSAGKRDLIKWTPTLHFYFPLAALAAYKGVIELATKPFYWDKTQHGQSFAENAPSIVQPPPSPHSVSTGS